MKWSRYALIAVVVFGGFGIWLHAGEPGAPAAAGGGAGKGAPAPAVQVGIYNFVDLYNSHWRLAEFNRKVETWQAELTLADDEAKAQKIRDAYDQAKGKLEPTITAEIRQAVRQVAQKKNLPLILEGTAKVAWSARGATLVDLTKDIAAALETKKKPAASPAKEK